MKADPKSPIVRPYLRVLFECCNIYQRIYRRPSEQFYNGRCPRCLRQIRFQVSPTGTAVRDFSVR